VHTGFWWGDLKIQLGRPLCTWEDNIEMDLQGLGWGGLDWIALGHDRDRLWSVAHAVMNILVPYNGGNFFTS